MADDDLFTMGFSLPRVPMAGTTSRSLFTTSSPSYGTGSRFVSSEPYVSPYADAATASSRSTSMDAAGSFRFSSRPSMATTHTSTTSRSSRAAAMVGRGASSRDAADAYFDQILAETPGAEVQLPPASRSRPGGVAASLFTDDYSAERQPVSTGVRREPGVAPPPAVPPVSPAARVSVAAELRFDDSPEERAPAGAPAATPARRPTPSGGAACMSPMSPATWGTEEIDREEPSGVVAPKAAIRCDSHEQERPPLEDRSPQVKRFVASLPRPSVTPQHIDATQAADLATDPTRLLARHFKLISPTSDDSTCLIVRDVMKPGALSDDDREDQDENRTKRPVTFTCAEELSMLLNVGDSVHCQALDFRRAFQERVEGFEAMCQASGDLVSAICDDLEVVPTGEHDAGLPLQGATGGGGTPVEQTVQPAPRPLDDGSSPSSSSDASTHEAAFPTSFALDVDGIAAGGSAEDMFESASALIPFCDAASRDRVHDLTRAGTMDQVTAVGTGYLRRVLRLLGTEAHAVPSNPQQASTGRRETNAAVKRGIAAVSHHRRRLEQQLEESTLRVADGLSIVREKEQAVAASREHLKQTVEQSDKDVLRLVHQVAALTEELERAVFSRTVQIRDTISTLGGNTLTLHRAKARQATEDAAATNLRQRLQCAKASEQLVRECEELVRDVRRGFVSKLPSSGSAKAAPHTDQDASRRLLLDDEDGPTPTAGTTPLRLMATAVFHPKQEESLVGVGRLAAVAECDHHTAMAGAVDELTVPQAVALFRKPAAIERKWVGLLDALDVETVAEVRGMRRTNHVWATVLNEAPLLKSNLEQLLEDPRRFVELDAPPQ